MSEPGHELDALLDKLEQLASSTTDRPGDAIDRIRRGPRRRTETRDLRHHPAMQNFRRELTDGLIRTDTANQLLRLIASLLTRLT